MLGLLPHLESTPPLYYCVAWVWGHVFGLGPAGLKSLSALCGTLTIPIAYATARKLLANRRSALIVAALTACNPLLIWYSQEARAYSMLVLFSACTLLAFAYARERPRALPLTLWALASALALADALLRGDHRGPRGGLPALRASPFACGTGRDRGGRARRHRAVAA